MKQAAPLAATPPALFLTPTEVLASYPQASTQPRQLRQLRRRPSPQQGIALEILGHAIEYLLDSNFYHQRANDPAVQEAIHILKQSNREVFASAPEVVPARARATRWLRSHLHPQTAASNAARPIEPPRLFLVKR